MSYIAHPLILLRSVEWKLAFAYAKHLSGFANSDTSKYLHFPQCRWSPIHLLNETLCVFHRTISRKNINLHNSLSLEALQISYKIIFKWRLLGHHLLTSSPQSSQTLTVFHSLMEAASKVDDCMCSREYTSHYAYHALDLNSLFRINQLRFWNQLIATVDLICRNHWVNKMLISFRFCNKFMHESWVTHIPRNIIR